MDSDKKKKLKYNLNPRGNIWANDESKKCQKMMEKFGWEKGKGLGRNEDGIKDNIRANGNMGKKGFGCTSQARNNWLFQQDEFSSLLENLNQIHGKKDDKPKEGTSFDLGETCKKSKSKVYYSKLVEGKNLATKSQKDLDCILGPNRKKKTKKEEPAKITSPEIEEKPEEPPKEAPKSTDLLKTQAVNMYAYFAEKMAAKKRAAAMSQNDGVNGSSQNEQEVSLASHSEPESLKKRKHSDNEDDNTFSCDEQELANGSSALKGVASNAEVDEEEGYKPKKKRKKSSEEDVTKEEIIQENHDEQKDPKKMKKNKKNKDIEQVDSMTDSPYEEIVNSIKRGKSKKYKGSKECESLIDVDDFEKKSVVPEKKGKKKKHLDDFVPDNFEGCELVNDSIKEKPKAGKIIKKNKKLKEDCDELQTEEEKGVDHSPQKKKKKSKHD